MTDCQPWDFTYNYDIANRQTLVTTPAGRSTTLAYDPLARVTHQTYASGATTAQSYDAAGNLSQITHSNDGGLALVSQLTYLYNGANQRTLVTEYDGTQTAWTYDGKYQLTSETQTNTPTGLSWSSLTVNQWSELTVDQWAALPVDPPSIGVGYDITHTYDPAGNRTIMNDRGTVTTFTYSNANRLTLANANGVLTTYTNDLAGNRTSMEQTLGTSTYTTMYTWDAAGNMTVAEPPSGTVTFTYNAMDQRVLKDTGSVSGYLYDHKKLLAETDGESITSLYTTTTDQEYGDLIDEDGGDATHLYDAQANTNTLLDASGNVLAQYKYYAFGNIASYSIDGAPWSNLDTNAWNQMTTEQWAELTPGSGSTKMLAGGKKQYFLDEETSLYMLGMGNNQGRSLDSSTARLTSEDPIRQASGDVNLYPIVENNPVNRLDPSGHDGYRTVEGVRNEAEAEVRASDVGGFFGDGGLEGFEERVEHVYQTKVKWYHNKEIEVVYEIPKQSPTISPPSTDPYRSHFTTDADVSDGTLAAFKNWVKDNPEDTQTTFYNLLKQRDRYSYGYHNYWNQPGTGWYRVHNEKDIADIDRCRPGCEPAD